MLPVAAIVLAGCGTMAPQPFDITNFDSLKQGVTTKSEAAPILGEATSRASSLNNHTTLMYNCSGPPLLQVRSIALVNRLALHPAFADV